MTFNVPDRPREDQPWEGGVSTPQPGGVPGNEPADPWADDAVETRFVQPYQANKSYLCPGCNRDIPPGTGHMVAVPIEAPDLRRHARLAHRQNLVHRERLHRTRVDDRLVRSVRRLCGE